MTSDIFELKVDASVKDAVAFRTYVVPGVAVGNAAAVSKLKIGPFCKNCELPEAEHLMGKCLFQPTRWAEKP